MRLMCGALEAAGQRGGSTQGFIIAYNGQSQIPNRALADAVFGKVKCEATGSTRD